MMSGGSITIECAKLCCGPVSIISSIGTILPRIFTRITQPERRRKIKMPTHILSSLYIAESGKVLRYSTWYPRFFFLFSSCSKLLLLSITNKSMMAMGRGKNIENHQFLPALITIFRSPSFSFWLKNEFFMHLCVNRSFQGLMSFIFFSSRFLFPFYCHSLREIVTIPEEDFQPFFLLFVLLCYQSSNISTACRPNGVHRPFVKCQKISRLFRKCKSILLAFGLNRFRVWLGNYRARRRQLINFFNLTLHIVITFYLHFSTAVWNERFPSLSLSLPSSH